MITTETCKYAEQKIHQNADHLRQHKEARGNQWKRNPMKREEVNPFLAIILTMGIIGYPRVRLVSTVTSHLLPDNLHTNRDYWSTKWPFNTGIFSSIMSGRRFELLLSYLHLNDNEKQPTRESSNYDKLYKVRPFLDTLVSNFRMAYTPHQNLSVDESIISYKGRLSWIQYMPNKPTKWGMKAWCLADSINGYIWNLKIYTGRTHFVLRNTCKIPYTTI